MQNFIRMLVNFLCTHNRNTIVQAVILCLPGGASRLHFGIFVIDFEVSTEQSSPQRVAFAYLTPSEMQINKRVIIIRFSQINPEAVFLRIFTISFLLFLNPYHSYSINFKHDILSNHMLTVKILKFCYQIMTVSAIK